jgi:phosphoglycolate phosphatase-like HAD superfamily hydrolase
MKIVLFDIDGTLITTGGGAKQAFSRALSEAAGRPIESDGYPFSGKTDPQIARDILTANGVSGAALEAAIPEAIRLYLRYFAEALPRLESARVLPGVRELLDALAAHEQSAASLGGGGGEERNRATAARPSARTTARPGARAASRPGVRTALLTGNVVEGGRLKLGHFGLTHYFDFSLSCFASDDADRYRLPALALERARQALGPQITGRDLILVGDSEHDVLCGRSVGARSVAVATGWTSAQKLRALGADAVFEDFSDTARALEAILGNG